MKIGLVAPVKPSHPYLENDPAPLFDLHYRRLAPWLWFRASDNAKAGGPDNVFPPMQGWSGSGCDLSSGKLPQSTWASLPGAVSNRIVASGCLCCLTQLGFVQAQRKPWLSLFRLPGGVFFANFGSTEEVAIWEDPAALVHWKLDRYSGEMESALVEGVLARCRAAGAEVRVSFYNRMFDGQENPAGNSLTDGVDRTVLNRLLAEAARSFPEAERRLAQGREATKKAEQVAQAEAERRRQEAAEDRKRAQLKDWDSFDEWFRSRQRG